jgi:organic radical activating enzyme
MQTWKEYYNSLADPSWPKCETEKDYLSLPEDIRNEMENKFGYRYGTFHKAPTLPHKKFPIHTETACQLKWNWSTVFLTTEKTGSCHRTSHHSFDTDMFDFHNTPQKLDDRRRMLNGEWPEKGCDYCKSIEIAGGQSDRITNLDLHGQHAPLELSSDPTAISVTPRTLEVYFDNTCNLKCLYCKPQFSSLWDAENKKYGDFKVDGEIVIRNEFDKSPNIESNKLKLFEWLKLNSKHLTGLNILGGEPFYQPELDQCLDLLEEYPAPEITLMIFTNLNMPLLRLKKVMNRVKKLIDNDCIRAFEMTTSLDCWGPAQEYVRYPLNLKIWEENFKYLLTQDYVNLVIGSTVTPLTIKTLPDLLEKIQEWSQIRKIYHYQNSVIGPSYLFIDMFGDIFKEDFEKAIRLKPEDKGVEISSKEYLKGIYQQSISQQPDLKKIKNLFFFLNEIDRRRGTHWQPVFPWLVDEFKKHGFG